MKKAHFYSCTFAELLLFFATSEKTHLEKKKKKNSDLRAYKLAQSQVLKQNEGENYYRR